MAGDKIYGVVMKDPTFVEDTGPRATHVSAVQRGFPDELRALKSMDTLGGCTKLEELTLRATGVTALPAALAGCTKLSTIDIQQTPITRLPAELARCTKLESILCDKKQLTDVPVALRDRLR
jgi:Leucine-rich repeat (LRR) protein